MDSDERISITLKCIEESARSMSFYQVLANKDLKLYYESYRMHNENLEMFINEALDLEIDPRIIERTQKQGSKEGEHSAIESLFVL